MTLLAAPPTPSRRGPREAPASLLESVLDTLTALAAAAYAVLFVTGGAPWIRGAAREWFGRYPFAHRLLLLVPLAVVLALLAARKLLVRSPLGQSPLARVFRAVRRISPWSFSWILFVLYAVMLSAVSISRHLSLNSSFDLAIFDQAVWNTLQGRFLVSSIKGNMVLLGDHWNPILVLVAPLFLVWDNAMALLVFQSVAVGLCIPIVYKLAEGLLCEGTVRRPAPWLLYAIPAAFFLYLPARNAVRFDFHPEVLADPLGLAAAYFLAKRRWIPAAAFLALTLMCKEAMFFVSFGFGLYLFFGLRKRFLGAFLAIASPVLLFALTSYWMPLIGNRPYLYAGLLLTDPAVLVRHGLSWEGFAYLLKLAAPLAFLPLAAGSALWLPSGLFVANLISRHGFTRSIFFQYNGGLIGLLFACLCWGAKRVLEAPAPDRPALLRDFSGRERRASVLAAALLTSSLVMMGVPEFYLYTVYRGQMTPHAARVREVLASIPKERSLRTMQVMAPHAAHREKIFIFENTHPLEGGSLEAQRADYVAFDRRLWKYHTKRSLLDLIRKGYKLDFLEGGFYVFRRPDMPARKARP